MGKEIKSIVFNDLTKCANCGAPYPEIHHIFYGSANRSKSTEYGLLAPLCCICHRDNKRGVHGQNKALDEALKIKGQKAFEEHYPELSFFKEFGKNYL